MRATHFRLFLALGLAWLTGCVESEKPLSDPAISRMDQRLFGLWQRRDPDGAVEYLHIGGEYQVPLAADRARPEPGLMQYTSIRHEPNNRAAEAPSGTRFFVTQIGGEDFGSWVFPQEEKDRGKPVHFAFYKYRVTPEQLEIWDMDRDATAAAIEAGKLKGVVRRKQRTNAGDAAEYEELRITDSSENIAKFLADGGAKSCFLESGKATYQRVK
ncbi:MAG: hypothetical protein AB7U73_15585 [Pirellulales bacterium]